MSDMGANDAAGMPSEAARTAIAEEMVLNAAMAFAGHVATAAQDAARKTAEQAPPALRETIVRQFFLETATLCLRRLGDSYGSAADDPTQADHVELMRDGARRAGEATASVEALGDLGLDLLDRLLEG
jgi:hypothetical protein